MDSSVCSGGADASASWDAVHGRAANQKGSSGSGRKGRKTQARA